MGILGDLKKIFFGAEALGKSAANKGKDIVKEKGEVIWDKASDAASTASKTVADRTDDLRDAILHTAEGTINTVSKSETLKNVAEKTEQIGEKVLSKGEELLGKGAEQVEKLGSTILGENNENLEKAKEFTAGVGSKVLDAKDKLKDKADELLEDINEKIDDTIAKGKAMDEMEAAKPKKDLHEVLEEKSESMLKDTDDFFSKASKYADGDYSAAAEGQIKVQESSLPIEPKDPAKAAGFTDLDGDGNELVDDALIIAEEE